MYTIKRAAELTGVGTATLRAWERRYGVLAPPRTPGGYRLYDEPTIEAIRTMRALVGSGWGARQAAQEVQRRRDSSEAPGPDMTDEGAFGRLRRAAADLSPGLLRDALEEGFGQGTFESVVDGWLMPALQAIGADWEAGRLSVAGEHLVAYAVLRRLATAYDAAARETAAARVVLGLPPGATHELGVFAFAACARRAGLATTYLGANVPVEDWVIAVGKDRPPYVVLAVPRREDVAPLADVVEALRAAHPRVRIGVGGRYQDLAPPPAQPLGHQIGPAADRLARLLAGDAPTPG
ncbi:MAG: MerR family transcriptional regulator [Dermatophilaceae bacterium]